jgi:hypothetical protein
MLHCSQARPHAIAEMYPNAHRVTHGLGSGLGSATRVIKPFAIFPYCLNAMTLYDGALNL